MNTCLVLECFDVQRDRRGFGPLYTHLTCQNTLTWQLWPLSWLLVITWPDVKGGERSQNGLLADSSVEAQILTYRGSRL